MKLRSRVAWILVTVFVFTTLFTGFIQPTTGYAEEEENLFPAGSFNVDWEKWEMPTREIYVLSDASEVISNWPEEKVDNGDGTYDILYGQDGDGYTATDVKYDNVSVKSQPQFVLSDTDSQDGDGKCVQFWTFDGYANWAKLGYDLSKHAAYNNGVGMLEPSSKYLISFYHKGDMAGSFEFADWSKPTDATVEFSLYTAGQNKETPDEPDEDWTKYEFEVTTCEDPNPWIYLKNDIGPNNLSYIDNIQVVYLESLVDATEAPEATETPVPTSTASPTTKSTNTAAPTAIPTAIPTVNPTMAPQIKVAAPVKVKVAMVKIKGKYKKDRLKISWKKEAGQYYTVQMSKFKNKKFKTIVKYKKNLSSFVKVKLKKNVKYYFRVRTYKKVDGKKVYSKYSKVVLKRIK